MIQTAHVDVQSFIYVSFFFYFHFNLFKIWPLTASLDTFNSCTLQCLKILFVMQHTARIWSVPDSLLTTTDNNFLSAVNCIHSAAVWLVDYGGLCRYRIFLDYISGRASFYFLYFLFFCSLLFLSIEWSTCLRCLCCE